MLSLKTALTDIANAINALQTEERLQAPLQKSLPYTATQDCICVVTMNPSTSSVAYVNISCGDTWARNMSSTSGMGQSVTVPLRKGQTLKVSTGSNYGTINALVFPLN